MRAWPIAVVLAVAPPVLGAAPTLPQAAQAPPQAQDPVFRASVDGVLVNVSVRQANQPVTGLTADDFELTDNGVPQEIVSMSFETLPIDVTLLLDASSSVQGRRLMRLKNSVVETASILDAEDRLRLIEVQFELHQIFPFQPGGAPPPVDELAAGGGTALLDGLAAAMMRAADPDRRQLIVAYTDGNDTTSILDVAGVREIADNADAVLHIVVPTSGGRNARNDVPAADALEDIARRTGGQLFLVDIDAPITDAFRQAIDEFRRSYVLRYRPTGVEMGGWHEIQVRVTGGEGYEVRARRGYGG